MPFTVLVTAPTLAAPGIQRLNDAHCRLLFVNNGEVELSSLLAREPIDAVISRAMTLSGADMEACRTLRVISKHGAGVNNVDVDAATRLGVPVFYTPGANAQAVAELTMGLLIAVARKIPFHDERLRSGEWLRSGDGLQLSGLTFGIIGLGQIGGRVARLAQAFGMNVVAYDPFVKGSTLPMVNSVSALVRQSDVVSLHCPLTNISKGMIGPAEIAQLRESAIVLNLGRGGLIDEDALVAALAARKIRGAGLDCFATEPLPKNSPFTRLENVVLSPHIGGSTVTALESVAEGAATTAIAYLRGEAVDESLCVNPETLRSPRADAAQ